MFVVLLRFSANKSQAATHMDGHNAWIRQGFDDNVLVVVGSLAAGEGGAIVAHNTTAEALRERVASDPFVIEKVVTAEIVEIVPKRVDPRVEFLLENDPR